jgi:hypothetical protein
MSILAFATFLCCIAAACRGGARTKPTLTGCGAAPGITDDAVTGRTQATNAVAVDVYVDATDSMIGFVKPTNGAYTVLLGRLEAAVNQGWVNTTLQYFKFGRTTIPITRDEYIEGTKTPAFYLDPRTHQTTKIDLAIARAANDRVTIVITDLFQDKSDVNRLVAAVKERCFRQGIDVGIVAVPAAFDGTVFDAPVGSYRFKSTDDPSTFRPFYLLMFGDAGNLLKLVEKLGGMHAIPPDRFFLISDHILNGYGVSVRKQAISTALIPLASPKPAEFSFRLKRIGNVSDGGTFDFCAAIQPKPGAPVIGADGVHLSAVKNGQPAEFTLRSLARDAGGFRGVVDYDTRRPPGRYNYTLVLSASNSTLKVPAWIAELSSANPRADVDGNRTLNLDLLVSGLLDAKTTMSPPPLAKFDVTIDRK